jgi:hypothetical protein
MHTYGSFVDIIRHDDIPWKGILLVVWPQGRGLRSLEKLGGEIIVEVGGGPGERRNGVRMADLLGFFRTVMRRNRALIRESPFDRNIFLSID